MYSDKVLMGIHTTKKSINSGNWYLYARGCIDKCDSSTDTNISLRVHLLPDGDLDDMIPLSCLE